MRLGMLSGMTDNETDPQRPGQFDPGAPDQTAELRQQGSGEAAGSAGAQAGGSPGRASEGEQPAPAGQPPQGGQLPQAGQPVQAGQPPQGGQPGQPDQTAQAGPAAGGSPHAGSGHTPAGPYPPPASPWAQPGPAQSSPPFAPPAPQASPASPWQPPYSARPGHADWQPTPSVPGSGGPTYPPQQPTAEQPPIWAAQPGEGQTTVLMQTGMPAGPGAYRQPGRAGRRLATAAAALALAVGSGVLGGWVALQADDDPPVTTNVSTATNASNRNSSPAPVINRDDLANVAAAVQPSVVSIKTDNGEGSGVVYDDKGDIVTNNHVVASADSDTVMVIFNDGKSTEGRVLNTDPRTDLAVVRVSNVSGLTPAKIGDSGAMRVGDTVLALGSPLGLEGTVTAGIISAFDRTIQVSDDQQDPFGQGQVRTISGLLQTDAPINPGNSGGALVNTKGEVIGINNAILGRNGNIGLGFAIPSNKMKAVVDQLIKGEKVKHPFLGVSVADSTSSGALVRAVAPNSPAAKAGIQEGDIITKFGDKTIGDSDDLVSAVQSSNVGDQLEVTYTRNGEQKTATVTLADAS